MKGGFREQIGHENFLSIKDLQLNIFMKDLTGQSVITVSSRFFTNVKNRI